MTHRALELIPEYVLGSLPDDERKMVEAEIERSPSLRAEVAATTEALSGLGEALPPIKPPSSLKERLLQSISSPEERHAPFAAKLARYFDLSVDRVRELLRSMYDPLTHWEPGPIKGVFLMHFEGGPRTATADVGFVRFPAGLRFPQHRHVGPEVNFVLEGTIRDSDGRIYGPGDALEKDGNTEHHLFVGEEQDGLIGVVVEGLEFLEPLDNPYESKKKKP